MTDIKTNKTIVHVFSILDAINSSPKPIGVSNLAHLIQLPKTTVFRLIDTLTYLNVVTVNTNQQYTIGPRIFSYAKSIENKNDLVRLATPYMKVFTKHTKESINIGILYENQVLYLHSEKGDEFSLQVNLLPIAPLYCSSMGKLFLSNFSNEQLNNYLKKSELDRRTINTINNVAELKKELIKIKKEKISYDNEEYEYGLTCIAVPLFHNNKLIAAASVSGPTSRLKARGWESIKKELFIFQKDVNQLL